MHLHGWDWGFPALMVTYSMRACVLDVYFLFGDWEYCEKQAKAAVRNPLSKTRCSCGFRATALCQLPAITAAQNVTAYISGVADGVNEL